MTVVSLKTIHRGDEKTMSYYEPKDLERFGEIGKFRSELAEKFFDYYNSVVGQDGALTKREKALIALAVAHSRQCPYCIDAYTTGCLENGANPDEMTEAIHVAAVMEAGITLVHGVQMHNALRRVGAM
jgi:alkylhydroperoxidase/carboxymuconolactone decarboxylase family protein